MTRFVLYPQSFGALTDERWSLATARFGVAIQRLEHLVEHLAVTLDDLNGPKGGIDKVCVAHVHLRSGERFSVSSVGNSFGEAVSRGAEKLRTVLTKLKARRAARRRKTPRNDVQ